MPNILKKEKGFVKNTLFYMLHAQRIHVKSHIIHHTIYKFGEKEDRYKKLRKDVIAAKKLSRFLAGMLPRVTRVVVVITMQCAY